MTTLKLILNLQTVLPILLLAHSFSSLENIIFVSTMMKAKTLVIKSLCEGLYSAYKNNGNRVPHKMFDSLIENNKTDFPTLKKNALKTAFACFKKQKEKETINVPAISLNTPGNNKENDLLFSTMPNDLVGEPTEVTPRGKGGVQKEQPLLNKGF